MKLIGMLDSPYVRRVAISLQLLGLEFEHHPLSVFRTFAEFQRINPVVKAPTLVCDDGTVLMDSTLILQYAQARAGLGRRLLPQTPDVLAPALRAIGLALAACEKSVQIVYERNLRPAEKRHAPWIDRISGQLLAAFDALEVDWRQGPARACDSASIGQSDVDVAVAWHFARQMVPDLVAPQRCPALQAHSQQAEALDEFRSAPFGDGTVLVGR